MPVDRIEPSFSEIRREYPLHPIVGVGGLVVHRNRVLLIRRGRAPLKGEWSIPGGMLELGEELGEAALRELKEETGLEVELLKVLGIFSRIVRRGKRVRYHYVIIDYACRLVGGRLKPASDVVEARWVRREDLGRYKLTKQARQMVIKAFDLCSDRGLGVFGEFNSFGRCEYP